MNSVAYITINLLAFGIGQWLVTRGHWAGFLVWCMANLYSALTCVMTGIPETSCLFAVYFIVNLASLRAWFTRNAESALENPPPKAVTHAPVRSPNSSGSPESDAVLAPNSGRICRWDGRKVAVS